MWPKISVHLPSYQQREFLREAVESVLAQGYPSLEIVVGDDGSTDGTHEMLREYERRHPGLFVLVLATENRGTTANWNQILPRCTGEYVAWLDGDDIWLPGKLHQQVEYMQAHPEVALSYTNADIFDSGSGLTLRFQHEPRRNPFRQGGAEQMLRSATFFVTSTVMARRSAIPAWGADARLKFTSDWLLWLDTARNGKIGYIEPVLTRYRMHAHNITKRGDGMLAEQLEMLGIAEGRYPEYLELTPAVRAECLWYHGLRYLTQGEHERATVCFRRSFHERFLTINVKTTHKAIILLLMSVGRLGAAVPAYALSRRLAGSMRAAMVKDGTDG